MNDVPTGTSRSTWDIVRANVFTPFNALLGGLLVVILFVGPLQDALFGGVLVANAAIGIFQELRAKRTLDRLAVLTAPTARVVRDGTSSEVAVGEVVLDDVLDLRPGDQVVVDGRVIMSNGLEIDESLVSGESEPVAKERDDELLSGSFVAAGSGRCVATRVGAQAYATAIAVEGRRFTLANSELRRGINRIIVMVTWVLIPTAALLFFSQLRSHHDLKDALRGSVAGVVAMVPEGLVLLTSVAFAASVVRLGRRRVLVQDLPAVETLARVDVLCVDKTGTLTEGRLVVEEIEPLRADASYADALGALAASDPNPNATLIAFAASYEAPRRGWRAERTVAFSSARKWSGASFDGKGSWLLGAPEVIAAASGEGSGGRDERDRALVSAASVAESGRRVLLLARSPDRLENETIPAMVQPVALVLLRDRIRPEAAETLEYFRAQGVTVKVLSGDHPSTVGAIASDTGVQDAASPVDARELPRDDPAALAAAAEDHSVFGRVTPGQKRSIIGALQSRGHVVAMTGDGVNDVLALKDSDLGVAMGSGSPATRSVAQLVLVDGSFASLPSVVAEGRRVLANIERTANLFLTKTVYAMLLALSIGVLGFAFPFLPRHLTLIGTLTIGIPGFFLALAPSVRRAIPGFVPRVLRFAAPAGALAAAATLTAYVLARREMGASLAEARSVATLVLGWIGLLILTEVSRPLTIRRRLLIAAMGAAFVGTFVIPAARDFFALKLPDDVVWLTAIGIGAICVSVMHLIVPEREY